MKSIYQTWKSKVVSDDYVKEYIDMHKNLYRKDKNGEYHSLYSPAVIWSNGNKFWYFHGKIHRLDGPAIEYANGSKFWWINDKCIGKTAHGFTQEKFEQYKINNNIK